MRWRQLHSGFSRRQLIRSFASGIIAAATVSDLAATNALGSVVQTARRSSLFPASRFMQGQSPNPTMKALQDKYTWAPDRNPSISEFLRTMGKLYIPEGQALNIFASVDNDTAWNLQLAAANAGNYQEIFPVVADDLDKIEWIEKDWAENRNDGQIYGYTLIRRRDGAGPIRLRSPFAAAAHNEGEKYFPNYSSTATPIVGSDFAMTFTTFNGKGNDRFFGTTADGKQIIVNYFMNLQTTTDLPNDNNSDPNKDFHGIDSNIIVATVPDGRISLTQDFYNYGHNFPDYDLMVTRSLPGYDFLKFVTPHSDYSLLLESQDGRIITTDIPLIASP